MSKTKFHAVIVAAGRSRRLGGEIAKPWIYLDDKMVITHAVEALSNHPDVLGGVIVASDDRINDAQTLAEPYGWLVVAGGAERSMSVRKGLEALTGQSPDAVLIHDAARPFVPAPVISRLGACFDEGFQAAIPVLPPSDSLKHVAEKKVTGRIDRNGIARVQTPQAFAFAPFWRRINPTQMQW